MIGDHSATIEWLKYSLTAAISETSHQKIHGAKADRPYGEDHYDPARNVVCGLSPNRSR